MNVVCHSREDGVLGLENLCLRTCSFDKWIWPFTLEPNSLWQRMVSNSAEPLKVYLSRIQFFFAIGQLLLAEWKSHTVLGGPWLGDVSLKLTFSHAFLFVFFA